MSSAKTFLQIDPSIAISHSGDEKSLAHPTARTRWPKIVASAIADVDKTNCAADRSTAEVEDGNRVLADLHRLLLDMENDQPMRLLPEDGAGDIQVFNDELELLGPITWHNSPWLFTECYLYRLIQTCFSRRATTYWKNYDVFAQQKERGLTDSKTSIVELVQFLHRATDASQSSFPMSDGDLKALFEEMLQVSLWGNSVDLLLLVHLSAEELRSRQGMQARQSFKENVVDDDTEDVWQILSTLKDSVHTREIHIVLDNAGFELLSDLVFVAYLLDANYASRIVLHGKAFSWFVSDATAQDLDFTIKTLKDASFSGDITDKEATELRKFGTSLALNLQSGKLRYEFNPFWTTQHCYARMPEYAPDLWAQLGQGDLIIFKGDLNYRKLVFDGLWPRTTTFQHALGKLGELPNEKQSGIRLLSLRTCKADTVVGLAPGKEEELDPEGTGEWSRNGKYAVISYYDGKPRGK
ncbi:hypothetical protein DL769_011052 [Monosporascus sp. CRB-8-3]|nr:hypothetical protein DL769_011052 [Monosporascus sp. CRB-8-3]